MTKQTILVVEDQADIRRLVRWALEDADYTIHEAANGSLGLQLARTVNPDLVLLDVMMPGGIDGFEVCRQLRQDASFARTRIVMLTAKATAEDREHGHAAGANAFLPKPFSPAKLLALVDALLKPTSGLTPG
jgi:DNA-binding response OmpR family regulator